MKVQKFVFLPIYIVLFSACNSATNKTENIIPEEKKVLKNEVIYTKGEILLKQATHAHGGNLYNSANYSFIFRDNTYQFKNNNEGFKYEKISTKNNLISTDILANGKLIRINNGDTIKLTDKAIKAAYGALNSVIYFATLPHKLNDASVIKTYIGETIIEDKGYNILGITFKQKGGGDDFEDEFHYWIDKETNKIDFLAYNYKVNKGGVRFRKAYNRRVVDGITFQDYVNYKAELGTPLKELPELYESGKLKELSKIETENIINLNTK